MDVLYSSWLEWDGDGFAREFVESAVYYTLGDVDLENDYVLRTLARTMKDDGVADSVSDAISMLEECFVTHGILVDIDGDRFPFYGLEEEVAEGITYEATWVEVSLDD